MLHLVRIRPDGEIAPARSIWFNRLNLHLARQLIFDPDGNILTDARYSDWQNYDGIPFPKQIEIDRPQDEYAVVLTVVKMENQQRRSRRKICVGATRGDRATEARTKATVTVKLVLENLKHRPMRSLLSIFLIAVPVTLILCLVGLSRGMLADSARRAKGVGADILVRPPKTSALTLSGAPLSEKLVDLLQKQPHVSLAVGMMTHPVSSATFISGVHLDRFNQMSGGFKYLAGGAFQGPNDIIVDEITTRARISCMRATTFTTCSITRGMSRAWSSPASWRAWWCRSRPCRISPVTPAR